MRYNGMTIKELGESIAQANPGCLEYGARKHCTRLIGHEASDTEYSLYLSGFEPIFAAWHMSKILSNLPIDIEGLVYHTAMSYNMSTECTLAGVDYLIKIGSACYTDETHTYLIKGQIHE